MKPDLPCRRTLPVKAAETENLLGNRHEGDKPKNPNVHVRARKLGFSKQEIAALKRLYAKVLNNPSVGS